jgi:hypothetical protein
MRPAFFIIMRFVTPSAQQITFEDDLMRKIHNCEDEFEAVHYGVGVKMSDGGVSMRRITRADRQRVLVLRTHYDWAQHAHVAIRENWQGEGSLPSYRDMPDRWRRPS